MRSGGAARSIHMYGKAFDWAERSSITNWQVAKFLYINSTNYNPSSIFLYDQFGVMYSNIPANFEDRPKTTMNPNTGDIVEMIYTHGHADWEDGF